MKFKILGTELEYDFLDAEAAEKLEDAMSVASEKLGELGKKTFEKDSEMIRAFCAPVHEAFDKIFGDGIAQKIFKKVNYADCMKAVAELTEIKSSAITNLAEEVKVKPSQPVPVNRQQRPSQPVPVNRQQRPSHPVPVNRQQNRNRNRSRNQKN